MARGGNMDTKKSTGYDSIPPRMLKPVARQLSPHVSSIFNNCVDSQIFPENAKLAEVIPLFKKDDSLYSNEELSSGQYPSVLIKDP